METPPTLTNLLRVLALTALALATAAMIGVGAAASTACVIGITAGTFTWCGFGFVWIIGGAIAIPLAVLIGLPGDYLFRKRGWRQWWQFALVGLVIAAPVWYQLAEPFASARWHSDGLFDTINYLGSGVLGGVAYWWMRRMNGWEWKPDRGQGQPR